MQVVILVVFLGLAAAKPADYYSDASTAISQIKTYLGSDEGIQTARDYIKQVEATHPFVFLIKAYIEAAPSEHLKELLSEVLKDIPDYGSLAGVDIHARFHEFGEFLRTEAGVAAIQKYFQNLQTDHQIIVRLKSMVSSADSETIRGILDALLPPSYYAAEADVKERLRDLFKQIREILITPEGILAVRDYARSVEALHPALFLVKAFIQSSSDEVLLEILDEVFKNFGDTGYYASATEKLESLFLQVKEIVDTEEGFAVLRNYLTNIRSEHPIVGRLHAFISQASDDTLRDILNALFGNI